MAVAFRTPPVQISRETILPKLFESLAGEWKLDRNLHSTNASEPSGKCYGKASFTPRSPSPILNEDGKLDLATAEMLYHEQGEFKLPSSLRLSFSKNYIWRLNQGAQDMQISVWFAKPGTHSIDYLFHKIRIPHHESTVRKESGQKKHHQIHGSGGHLCVDDFYNTSYDFTFDPDSLKICSWESLHEVRGPKKDQLIFTRFTKE